MLSSIVRTIWQAISACYDWVSSVYSSLGISFFSLVLVLVVVSLIGKHIISPIVGVGQSDKVENIPRLPNDIKIVSSKNDSKVVRSKNSSSQKKVSKGSK